MSDGTKIGVGEWACVPSGVINTDPAHYPSPDEFSGFRFVDPVILHEVDGVSTPAAMQPGPSKLTDVSHSFLMWGTGRMAW